jgi:GTP1/Obg family GTP-binding protein
VLQAGKDWIAKAKNAETAREANEAKQEGVEALINLYQQLAAEPVSGIVEIQRSLRSAPVIKLDTPAVVRRRVL